MAIYMITGRPGTGKTYILVKKALQFLAQGREVWSNFKIVWPKPNLHFFTKISELVLVKNGIVLMDEAQIYFNSRNWEALDERLQYKLQQHRKDGLDIYGTVQNFKRIDTLMRELVAFYYECSNIKFWKWEFFHLVEYDPEEATNPDKKNRQRLSSEWFKARQEIFDSYDTFAKISKDEADTSGFHQKTFLRCPQCGHDRIVG